MFSAVPCDDGWVCLFSQQIDASFSLSFPRFCAMRYNSFPNFGRRWPLIGKNYWKKDFELWGKVLST